MRLLAVTMLGFALLAPMASAQRDAISTAISPEIAGKAFRDAVIEGCVAAVASGQRLANAPGGGARFAVTTDSDTRRDVGAGSDETVWDVVAARGVVTIKEKQDRCTASVYGPSAAMTVMTMGQQLVAAGFERLAATQAPGISQSLYRVSNGRRVQVTLSGSEPGMPNHKSRFSVVTATVFSMPAG